MTKGFMGLRPATDMVKSGMNVHHKSTDKHDSGTGAKRWSDRVDAGFYQNKKLSTKNWSMNIFRLTLREPPYILVRMFTARKNSRRRATGLRDPERTRERLLQAAFREVYTSGYQSASLDTILAAAGVTKGALYYHFDSKEALGYALVEEIIAPDLRAKWLRPLQRGNDAIDTLTGIVQGESVRPEDVRGGCPLNNLAQEMSPLDEGFRKRLERLFHAWREGIAAALREGQAQGRVRRDVKPAETAGFLIATLEGYVSLAKNAQDAKVMKEGIRNIVGWLQSLRPPGNGKRR